MYGTCMHRILACFPDFLVSLFSKFSMPSTISGNMSSPWKHRHPQDKPTTHRLRPILVTTILIATAVDVAKTPATRKYVAVPPLPAPTPLLLQHGHHRDASTTSAVAVAYSAASVFVMFADAFENVRYISIRTCRCHLENHYIHPGVIIACFRLSCMDSMNR